MKHKYSSAFIEQILSKFWVDFKEPIDHFSNKKEIFLKSILFSIINSRKLKRDSNKDLKTPILKLKSDLIKSTDFFHRGFLQLRVIIDQMVLSDSKVIT